MHDAFEPVPILEKLPLQIDCLAAWGEPRGRDLVSTGASRTFHEPRKVDGRLDLWLLSGRTLSERGLDWGRAKHRRLGGGRWDLPRVPGILGTSHLPLLSVLSWRLSFISCAQLWLIWIHKKSLVWRDKQWEVLSLPGAWTCPDDCVVF